MTSQLTQPVWITRDTELADACENWADAEFLALDTEFVRTSTFYPILSGSISQHSSVVASWIRPGFG